VFPQQDGGGEGREVTEEKLTTTTATVGKKKKKLTVFEKFEVFKFQFFHVTLTFRLSAGKNSFPRSYSVGSNPWFMGI
tara:strand:+ start:240 stop:473 length:234 start_codon:yes stop_codon:yes gene_type:complete